ncbi:MAG: Rne/Rng family ribonuclease, partial [Clostridia bacterium]
MNYDILIDVSVCEKRLAIVEDGEAIEIQIERPFPERLVGNIYRGIVNTVLPGMQAAFVDIGMDKNAFLYAGDVVSRLDFEQDHMESETDILKDFRIETVLKAGQEIAVQVIKEPMGTKGPRVTTNISLPGRYVVLLQNSEHIGVSRRISDEDERLRLKELAKANLPKGFGLIMRTVAEGLSEEEMKHELVLLKRLSDAVEKKMKAAKVAPCIHKDSDLVERAIRDILTDDVARVIINDVNEYERILEFAETVAPEMKHKIQLYNKSYNLFEFYGVSAALDSIRERKVWLKSGGYLVIDKTEALTVIDVNTGKFTGSHSLEETVFKTNMEAAKEIPYQLRLRDIGGIIVVDFIDMKTDENQAEVLDLLKQEIRRDKTKATVIGMTGLGLIEITRKKVKQEVNTFLGADCLYCGGTGKITSPYVVVRRVEADLERLLGLNKHTQIPATPGPAGQQKVKVELHPSIAAVINARGCELGTVIKRHFAREIEFSSNSLLGYEEIRVRFLDEE